MQGAGTLLFRAAEGLGFKVETLSAWLSRTAKV